MSFVENLKIKLKIFTGDVFGGINSAIITLPQALAFGVATGFGAGAGLWGAIILCFVAGMLGPKVPLISGTTGPVAIVVASMMIALNNNLQAAVTVLIMAALLQLAASMTNLPSMVKYVPYPVISGFMNGVGTILIIMQLNPILGHPISSTVIDTIKSLPEAVSGINYAALGLGVLTLVICFAIPARLNRYIPAQLAALIIGTAVSVIWHFDVERISQISLVLPSLQFPHITAGIIKEFFPYALIFAIVASSESRCFCPGMEEFSQY